MSLLTAAEQRRRPALRRILLTAVVLVVVVAASVAVTLWVIDDPPDPTARTPAQAPVPGSSDPTAEEPGNGAWQLRPISAGPLILPPPAGSEQGIPTGFPHTTEGAISAAARFAQTAVGLDVEVARRLAEVAVAPSYPNAALEFVQAVRSARASFGLHADDATRGAYLTFQAQAYRVSDVTLDRLVVSVLGTVDGAGPATGGQGLMGTTGASYTLVWVESDWHIAGDGEQLADALPGPRSPQAYQNGWRDLALA